MTNESVLKLKATPGRYRVTNEYMMGRYCLVEVDEQGRVYQLDHNLKRDGILADDGWVTSIIVSPASEEELK